MLTELTTWIQLKSLLSWFLTWYIVLIWWYTEITQALFILMILDFLLWFMKAWKYNNIRSEKLKHWFIKMVWYSLWLIVLHQITIVTGKFEILWFTLVAFGTWYLAVNEWISCLKHLNDFWFKLPKVIVDKIKDFKLVDNIKK